LSYTRLLAEQPKTTLAQTQAKRTQFHCDPTKLTRTLPISIECDSLGKVIEQTGCSADRDVSASGRAKQPTLRDFFRLYYSRVKQNHFFPCNGWQSMVLNLGSNRAILYPI